MGQQRQAMVPIDDIRAAVDLLEEAAANGEITQEEAARRINNCRRAVTLRDLWKASGKRAGARRRSDWYDIRDTTFSMLAFLVMIMLATAFVTWAVARTN